MEKTEETKVKISNKKKESKENIQINELPVGTKVLWLLNKKEYTKVNQEKPFSRWESISGGVLWIDDVRIQRKDVFEVKSDEIN